MSNATKDILLLMSTLNWITLDVLLKKKLINYADIQDSIAAARERIPKQHYTKTIADTLNIMEQTFQPGRYQSPLNRPGEPQR